MKLRQEKCVFCNKLKLIVKKPLEKFKGFFYIFDNHEQKRKSTIYSR